MPVTITPGAVAVCFLVVCFLMRARSVRVAGTCMGPRTAAAALLLGVAIAGAARADQAPAVTHAIALYQSFEDAKAARAFRAILAAAPSRAVAAKAHLYLGLIAVNQ